MCMMPYYLQAMLGFILAWKEALSLLQKIRDFHRRMKKAF
jgi:hypothetical protein